MKTTIYIKKEIRSIDDLPKEDGTYFAHNKVSNKNIVMAWFEDDIEYGRKVWIRTCEWWLCSIELELPGDEEINEEAFIKASSTLGHNNLIEAAFYDGCNWLRDNIKEQLKLK